MIDERPQDVGHDGRRAGHILLREQKTRLACAGMIRPQIPLEDNDVLQSVND
jgi:hypothetical protein